MVDEYVRREYDQLLTEMQEFAIEWHRGLRCNCMVGYSEVNSDNYLPCVHMEKAQYQRFKQRIDELGDVFDDIWTEKIIEAMDKNGLEEQQK